MLCILGEGRVRGIIAIMKKAIIQDCVVNWGDVLQQRFLMVIGIVWTGTSIFLGAAPAVVENRGFAFSSGN